MFNIVNVRQVNVVHDPCLSFRFDFHHFDIPRLLHNCNLVFDKGSPDWMWALQRYDQK